jgi:hypothetical protein
MKKQNKSFSHQVIFWIFAIWLILSASVAGADSTTPNLTLASPMNSSYLTRDVNISADLSDNVAVNNK